MTTNNSTHRSIASLNLPLKVALLITYTQAIVKGMTGNPAFPNPIPALALVASALAALNASETAALARTKGAVATRNADRAALIGLLQQLKAYVQAAADADPEHAPAIIQSAGIAVRKTKAPATRAFHAAQGAVSGSAKLAVPAVARRASYDWEYSADGGKTWVEIPSTLQAKTTVSGLQPGSTAQFRYRPVTKTGEGDWSQPVSLIVK